MHKFDYVAREKNTFFHTLKRLVYYLFISIYCDIKDHKWGDWYEGEVGKNIWKEEHECQRCHKVEGRGGFLPPKPWPDPPERNE